jgi:two-component system nitrate/nitrite response regulator NarL
MTVSLDVAEIRLLLVDDHAMFRQGIVRLFEKEPQFKIVGQYATAAEALEKLAEGRANMILLDVDLGSERAVDFVLEVRKRGFNGKVLVLTAGASPEEAVQLVRAGVAGILHEYHSSEELSKTIRRVAAGEVCLENDYMPSLFRSVDITRPLVQPTLNDRDKAVLRLVCQGFTNRQIGGQLRISESGAKSALRQLFEKLGVRTRSQLVRVALEQYRGEL